MACPTHPRRPGRSLLCAGIAFVAAAGCAGPGESAAKGVAADSVANSPSCPGDNGGITLPAGFCATVFADSVGGARHIAVAPNGDVFVQLIAARQVSESGTSAKGGILAMRDRNRDGKADSSVLFGEIGGTGIAVRGAWLYSDEKSRIVRYPLTPGSLTPSGSAETIVSGLPTGGHGSRNIAIDSGGSALYVNVGSRTNSCQQKDRGLESAGVDPCTELDTRAGLWRFDAGKTGQSFGTSARFATGIRNGMGLTINPLDGKVYTTQHGRDQLFQNWPKLYDAVRSAENPAEEFMQVNQGDDFGWPYCYFDVGAKKLLLAPEYGGDGVKVDRCAGKKPPLVWFPGHWAPMSSAFYTGNQFPARYRGGVFIAFHGSWNRAPQPQAGYRVVFVPLSNGSPGGAYETFSDGFAGGQLQPATAKHRPTGLAVSPDGSLFITDDSGGRIWRVTYTGGRR
ncbi:MAG: PQQ-dependent sugar dehydrogenase [Gemmatimonadota bacterium]|nr:PQQ-dependent sugar dehydrogenase [Gemmatimonadota bacterium]